LFVRVRWPRSPEPDRDRARTASSSTHKTQAPDTAKRGGNIEQPIAAGIACGTTLFLGLVCSAVAGTGGALSGIAPIVLFATPPVATIAAGSSAGAVALAEGAHVEDLSPWLSLGTAFELAGLLVLGAD